jgi:hypothetical protein
MLLKFPRLLLVNNRIICDFFYFSLYSLNLSFHTFLTFHFLFRKPFPFSFRLCSVMTLSLLSRDQTWKVRCGYIVECIHFVYEAWRKI